MSESEICAIALGMVFVLTALNLLLILVFSLKFYIKYIKERAKSKEK